MPRTWYVMFFRNNAFACVPKVAFNRFLFSMLMDWASSARNRVVAVLLSLDVAPILQAWQLCRLMQIF